MIFISPTKSRIKSILKRELKSWTKNVHIKFRSKCIRRMSSHARFCWESYSQSISQRPFINDLIWPEDNAPKKIVETDSCVDKIDFITFRLKNSRASWLGFCAIRFKYISVSYTDFQANIFTCINISYLDLQVNKFTCIMIEFCRW